jgi:glycosyltransferase involved in cell wall biosynthesis
MNYQISILLVTYNHEEYIDKALSSLLCQTIEGPIEVVIADDRSSDNTLDIIKRYEGRDARLHFKYLNSTANIGITKNYQRGFAACTGEYVAVLEGDDYWYSSLKLKRQLDFLYSYSGCDLCSVNYFVYEEDQARFTIRTAIGREHRFIGARDLIADNLIGNFSTCMYRKSALDKLPKSLYEIKAYDWILNICIARHSMIGFLEEPMSVYRLHSRGAWTQKSSIEKLKEQIELIPTYDELTEYIFKDDFKNLANYLQRCISGEHIRDAMANAFEPMGNVLPTISDFIPPILITIVHALLPPKLKHFIIRMFHRGLA